MALTYQENVPLAPLTTFGVGGDARLFAEAVNESDIEQAFIENRDKAIFVLGGGSNVLISDRGFDGLVLKIATRGLSFDSADDATTFVTAEAGEDWDEFVAECVGRNLAGVECLSGIPGLVGGTPIQNVGAYGQEVSETIVSVRVLDRATGETSEVSNADCGFEYRRSVFNGSLKDRFVVLTVSFKLKQGGSPRIEYGDLKRTFGKRKPGLSEVRNAVREIRASKGMLVRQGGPDSRSAGSFFKNPVVGSDGLRRIARVLMVDEASVPRFDMGKGNYKVPAAWLIERAGFEKGYLRGRAGISTLHSLALTNRGGAEAEEIIALKEEIETAIGQRFQIDLVNEPNLIGFD